LVVERWSYLDTDQLQRQRIEFTPLSLRTHAGDFGRIYVVDQREGLRSGEQPLGALGIQLEPGEYRFTRYGTYLNMADFRWLSVELRLLTGEFYTGTRDDVELDVRWTPNKYFFSRLAYNLRYYDVNGVSAAARQVTWRNEVAFNAEWSLVALAQYDNISDRVAINTRLRYNPRAGQDLWLVLNHNMQHLPDENRFETVQTQAVVKLTYTFRF